MLPHKRRWVLAHTELGCAGLHKTFRLKAPFLLVENRRCAFLLTLCGHCNMFAYV